MNTTSTTHYALKSAAKFGSRNPRAKLTPAVVKRIRAEADHWAQQGRWPRGRKQALAAEHSISAGNLSAIITIMADGGFRTWNHLV